ncbi:MAG: hypothetical protein B6D34_10310 [Candidatus Brocadia sp. UTAMX1]|jgi:hypothetical protein|nr:MAG: hypothetical protein B6D34_10310 [Candidatus Brocadia sp. UTAMX1]
MIIWSGFGFLVAIIGFASLLLTEVITKSSFHDEAYYQTHGWPKLVAFWVAAVLVYFVGLWLDRQPGRAMIDKATDQEVVLRRVHALFFIPVRYWPYIFSGLGVVFLFIKDV